MRILVADDDPDIRALVVRALRQEFGTAAGVEELADRAALDRALAAAPAPDLLVSDLSLGWTDGFAILAAVRAARSDCPAVMFTGTGNEEVAVRALKAGFDDYVVKSERQLRRLAAACRSAVERAEERRAHVENRDVLTQELYHRLHNNLQLVIGLMAFTARAVADPDARAKIEDLSRRVRSLALLQEQLYRGQDWHRVDFKAFLAKLVDDLVALDPRPIAVSTRLEDVELRVDQAVPLALIANELVTNSLRHAFAGRTEGGLAISLRLRDEGGLLLEVADDGVGHGDPLPEEVSPGHGMGLVRRLARQIGGKVAYGPGEGGGTTCRVTVGA
ncbi:MAG TPA: histidine kinase dimerization/phosphoacceptor domain -containing protein [Falsiroseomonas sp.]|jgi:two-component sensor histidine kinase|nr:histidine kinase dimerization/phosphoacceptor domain -containing protein [Falsiroseomonas sp.]